MNAVLLAVIVMLLLALCRVHVVLSLFIGALVGGLVSGMGLDATMVAFQDGLSGCLLYTSPSPRDELADLV